MDDIGKIKNNTIKNIGGDVKQERPDKKAIKNFQYEIFNET